MKKISRFVLWMTMIVLLVGAAAAETKVMVVSDIHYLDSSLYEGSELFLQILRAGDGKFTHRGEELLSALERQIIREQPDALIVTGDLIFNGDRESHETLAAWFGKIERLGVPVWVIPGNHDIHTKPVAYRKTGYSLIPSVTPEEFAAIYADFLKPGSAGFSYLAPVSEELWIAMTDVAWYQEEAQTFGVFKAAHEAWLAEALKEAETAGARVVTATHHSLIPHTEFSKESYLMFGHEKMAALLRSHGVKLNLSGHLHIQHIARENGLADAALGAFSIWPHRFALVTLQDDGTLSYEARSLDADLLPEGSLEESRAWFAGITREKTLSRPMEGTEEEKSAMADFAARFNLAYFSGTYLPEDPSWTEDPALALWKRQENTSFWNYMRMVMNERSGDNLRWAE